MLNWCLRKILLWLFKRNYGLLELNNFYYIEFSSKVKAVQFLEKWVKTPLPQNKANAYYGDDGSVVITISK